MIENEMNWPGWSGRLIYADGRKDDEIYPIDRSSSYRVWELPKGQYELQVTFTPLHLRMSLYCAAIFFITSVSMLLVITLNWHSYRSKNLVKA